MGGDGVGGAVSAAVEGLADHLAVVVRHDFPVLAPVYPCISLLLSETEQGTVGEVFRVVGFLFHPLSVDEVVETTGAVGAIQIPGRAPAIRVRGRRW